MIPELTALIIRTNVEFEFELKCDFLDRVSMRLFSATEEAPFLAYIPDTNSPSSDWFGIVANPVAAEANAGLPTVPALWSEDLPRSLM